MAFLCSPKKNLQHYTYYIDLHSPKRVRGQTPLKSQENFILPTGNSYLHRLHQVTFPPKEIEKTLIQCTRKISHEFLKNKKNREGEREEVCI